ncbi:LysM peptidoglycan-binding domain-containing protein [Streptomyces sp. NPDC002835]
MASLLLLAGVLVGLPWLLLHATAAVAASGLDDLRHLFTRSDTTGAFLLALALVGWIGWAAFAVSVLVEIPAQLRGRSAPQLPGLRTGQRAAATLVGAIIVLLPTGTAMASTTASPVTAVATQTPPSSPARDASVAQEGPSGAEHREYTVRDTRPAESLWRIAEDELGSGERFEDIVALNEGRTMPDGSRFTANVVLQPGWTLLLPGPADAKAAQTAGAEAGSYTVRPGDFLSKIAHAELGDGNRWPELYAENRDQIADPDLIRPGQQLDLPHDTRDASEDGKGDEKDTGSSAPGTPAPTEPAPPPADRPDTGPGGDTSPAPSQTDQAPAPAASTPGPEASPSPQPSTAHPGTPVADHEDTSPLRHAALVAGIGALLAASLTGALALKRILQQRRRRAGETIAIKDPTTIEQIANASAAPSGVALLDAALRALASHSAESGADLPAIRGARITDSSVILLPDDPTAPAPQPFKAGQRRGTWVLDREAPLDDGGPATGPAYPSLVTLGAAKNGDLLLTDLLHTRALLLGGGNDDVLAVCRALALEAGTNLWSRQSEILTVGLGQRLAALLPKGRIRAMPHLSAVIADIGELLLELHQHRDNPSAVAGPLPWILISAVTADAEEAWQLADAVSAARGLQICVVLPATDDTRRAFPEALEISAVPDALVELPDLTAEPIRLQRLTDVQYQQYVHALEVAETPAEPASDAWTGAHDHSKAAAEPAQPGRYGSEDPSDPFPALLSSVRLPAPATEKELSDEAPAGSYVSTPQEAKPDQGPEETNDRPPSGPYIEVLGPLRIRELDTSGQALKVAVLAALIHLRPGRTATWLCEAMDPLSPWSVHTLQNRLTEIRNRFGSAPDGGPYLPRPKNGYAFRPEVTSDWQRFQNLAQQGLTAGPPAGLPFLEKALTLVRGRPFHDGAYPWAAPIQQEMLSRIVDIAHTLAAWHAEGDSPDLDAARQTVQHGLDIDESAEVLYRDWISIERAAGNSRGLQKAVERTRDVARTYDIALAPETEQAIHAALAGERAPVPLVQS